MGSTDPTVGGVGSYSGKNAESFNTKVTKDTKFLGGVVPGFGVGECGLTPDTKTNRDYSVCPRITRADNPEPHLPLEFGCG